MEAGLARLSGFITFVCKLPGFILALCDLVLVLVLQHSIVIVISSQSYWHNFLLPIFIYGHGSV
jgi:hypothetical protein